MSLLILFTIKCWLKEILEAWNWTGYRILCSKGFLIVAEGIKNNSFNKMRMTVKWIASDLAKVAGVNHEVISSQYSCWFLGKKWATCPDWIQKGRIEQVGLEKSWASSFLVMLSIKIRVTEYLWKRGLINLHFPC